MKQVRTWTHKQLCERQKENREEVSKRPKAKPLVDGRVYRGRPADRRQAEAFCPQLQKLRGRE